MPEHERTIDRGVEGPPTEAERQMLQGLTQLDALRAKGNSGAVRQFLQDHPQVAELDTSRRDILKRAPAVAPARQVRAEVGAGVQERERAREQWMQKATEAWNVADTAFKAAHPQGREAASEAFEATWKAKCQEFQLGDINLKWQKGVYAVTDSYGGNNYIFVSVRADLGHPLLRAAFNVAPTAQQGNSRVQKPASMRSDIYAAINGDLGKADEHEFEKGELV